MPRATPSRRALLAALLVPLGTGCGLPLPRAGAFVDAAQSVRVDLYVPGRPPTVIEIQCPDRLRVRTAGPLGPVEYVVIGDRVLGREGDRPWRPASLRDLPPAPRVCRRGAWSRGEIRLASLLRLGHGRRGFGLYRAGPPYKEVDGVTCEYYTTRLVGTFGGRINPPVSVCVSVADERPLQVAFADRSAWTFRAWNVPLEIGLPMPVVDKARTPGL